MGIFIPCPENLMHAQKVTISISQPLYKFIETYQSEHHCKNRSDVISTALQLLQQKQYQKHNVIK